MALMDLGDGNWINPRYIVYVSEEKCNQIGWERSVMVYTTNAPPVLVKDTHRNVAQRIHDIQEKMGW